MSKSAQPNAHRDAMDLLSKLVLSPAAEVQALIPRLQAMSAEEFEFLMEMAHSNHVVIRGMEIYRSLMLSVNDMARAAKALEILDEERARIAVACSHLHHITAGFDAAKLDITVIKTLDHWPDYGSDIDLYTNADPDKACALMQSSFGAKISERSWGDRLAGKWNFEIPGLPESVEIHMCRLGQTGEHTRLGRNVSARARTLRYGDYSFRVASASDRIMISTLQRMYRHFYFRLCDILDSASLVTTGQIDWQDLQREAKACGIWEGTATYMVLVSDYVKRYSGTELALPAFVREAARFNGSVMYTGGLFLRVPIVPQAAGLYGSQLVGTLRRGEMTSTARLGVLPWLATVAAIGYKLTGSDKGIW